MGRLCAGLVLAAFLAITGCPSERPSTCFEYAHVTTRGIWDDKERADAQSSALSECRETIGRGQRVCVSDGYGLLCVEPTTGDER
jgi:hypothetical protein